MMRSQSYTKAEPKSVRILRAKITSLCFTCQKSCVWSSYDQMFLFCAPLSNDTGNHKLPNCKHPLLFLNFAGRDR